MTLLHLTTVDAWAPGRIEPSPGDAFVHLSRPDQVHVPANLLYAGRRDLVALALDPSRLSGEVREEGGFPHLYGAVLPDAVLDVAPFLPEDDGTFQIVFAPVRTDRDPAAGLVEALVAELEPLYGRIDGEDTPSAAPDDLWFPTGTFLVGHRDGEVVAGGGVKTLQPGLGEIKRMYVVPAGRSTGLARRLLTQLEDAARRLDHHRVRLDTGPHQHHARALYASVGYVEIPDYNANPHADYWAEKTL